MSKKPMSRNNPDDELPVITWLRKNNYKLYEQICKDNEITAEDDVEFLENNRIPYVMRRGKCRRVWCDSCQEPMQVLAGRSPGQTNICEDCSTL